MASLGAAMAASSFVAQAGDADPSHLFVNGNVGASRSDLSGLTSKTSWGYGLNFGYRWRDTWGAEAGYVNLGRPKADNYVSGGYPYNLRLNVSGWTLGLNGRWTFAENWHASARLGAFFSRSKLTAQGNNGKLTANDTNLYVGAGVGYDILPQLSVGLNIDRYQAKAKGIINGTNNPLLVSGTLEYRFILR
jgi:hypothetical protein